MPGSAKSFSDCSTCQGWPLHRTAAWMKLIEAESSDVQIEPVTKIRTAYWILLGILLWIVFASCVFFKNDGSKAQHSAPPHRMVEVLPSGGLELGDAMDEAVGADDLSGSMVLS